MERQWRNNAAWECVGSASHRHPPAPQLPARPTMRVRAIGRSFCVNGRVVPVGDHAVLDAADARRLIDTGKAELP